MRGPTIILAALAVSLTAGCATSPESAQTAKRPPEPTWRERANYLFETVRLSEAQKFDEAIGLLLRLQAVESPDTLQPRTIYWDRHSPATRTTGTRRRNTPQR